MATGYADLILVNSNVLTLGNEPSKATAVAISGKRILAVGDDSLCDDLRGAATTVVDLRGATVTPGLVDSHTHPAMGLQMTQGVDLSGCATLDDVRASLAAAGRDLGRDEWLTGWGLDPNVFGNAALGYEVLGSVMQGRPVVLSIFDGHSLVVSEEVLRRAHIDGPREFDSRSVIVCDESGRPTGHLLEEGAQRLVLDIIPSAGVDERRARLAELLAGMAATGLTGGHVMDLDDDALGLYQDLDEQNALPLRLRLAPWCRPDDSASKREAIRGLVGKGGRLWSVAAVKLFMDGTIDGGTAWLHEPDCHGESTAAYWRDSQDYTQAVRFFAQARVQTATHAIGDAAVQHVLDTLERVTPSGSAVRHRVEHIETLPTDQVHRFAQLGVVASMQPTHATDYTKADHTDNWSERLGDLRADDGWRCRDIWDAGGVVTLGSDWPVAPYDPRGVLAAAQLRRPAGSPDAAPVGPAQALTALQALSGYTRAPAYAAGMENSTGRIAAGYLADLTVLAEDPIAVPPEDLPHVPVRMTIVDGRILHRSEAG